MQDNDAVPVGRPGFVGDSDEFFAMFARAWALPREFGKCNTEVKVWLPADTVDELDLVTKALSTTKGEFVRFLVMRELYGKERVRIIDPYKRAEPRLEAFQSGTATAAVEPEQTVLEMRS